MKFKGQGKINICGFEYKKNIADSRVCVCGGGGSEHPKKNCIRACFIGPVSILVWALCPKCPVSNALLPSGHNVTLQITGEAATIGPTPARRTSWAINGYLLIPPDGVHSSPIPQMLCIPPPPKTCKFPPGGHVAPG